MQLENTPHNKELTILDKILKQFQCILQPGKKVRNSLNGQESRKPDSMFINYAKRKTELLLVSP